jgi:hypothetical protein
MIPKPLNLYVCLQPSMVLGLGAILGSQTYEIYKVLGQSRLPHLVNLYCSGAIHVSKSNKFMMFLAMHGSKPKVCSGVWAIHGSKLYKSIGFGGHP